MRSACAAPLERSSAATRLRSASMRRYTDSEISGVKSTRFMRTSTMSMPTSCTRACNIVEISRIATSRSLEVI